MCGSEDGVHARAATELVDEICAVAGIEGVGAGVAEEPVVPVPSGELIVTEFTPAGPVHRID